MKQEFKKALERVLVHEGGKVDDPQDPGGRTNQGVTQKSFNAYLSLKGEKPRDVFTMKNSERDEIYKRRYWDAIEGDKMPPGLGYVLFDGAVNSGAAQSVKWLQRALGPRCKGKIDGQLGPLTLHAIKETNDHDALIEAICIRRMDFLDNLKTWKRFGKGWTRRVENVKQTGQAWAMGSVGPPVEYIEGAEAKARLEDAKPLPTKAPGDLTTGFGVALTGATQGIGSAKDELAGFSNIEFVQRILFTLTVAGLVLVFVGFAYRSIMKYKESKMKDALDLDPNPDRSNDQIPIP